METKICSKCGRELPIDQFNWRNKAKGTRRADCKECHSGYMKMPRILIGREYGFDP